jgi:hypothetical protein
MKVLFILWLIKLFLIKHIESLNISFEVAILQDIFLQAFCWSFKKDPSTFFIFYVDFSNIPFLRKHSSFFSSSSFLYFSSSFGLVFWDRILLCNPGWTCTCSPPVLASSVVEL